MLAPANLSPESVRAIGELCVDGDWACAHGDLGALRHIARTLAARLPEPLHCELTELADACAGDARRAMALWSKVKTGVYRACEP